MGAKTLFLGIDGQSAGLIDEKIAAGSAPALAEIDSRLARIEVENDPGFGDGPYWTSVSTGCDPSGHGDYYILQFDPKTYDHYWYDESKHMTSPAFWEALDAEGKRVAIIDWPHCPFHPIRNGVHVDNWLQHDTPSPARSHPEGFIRDVIARYGDDPYRPGMHIHPIETADDAKWAVEAACDRIDAKARFCVDQLRSGEWDFFSAIFSEAHDVGHNGFHLHDRNHPGFDAALAEAAGDPMHPICVATDRAVRRIIEAAGPDCEVIVMAGLGLMPLVTANGALDTITRRLDLGYSAEEAPIEKARAAYRAKIPLSIRSALSPIKRFLLGEPKNPELARRRFFPVLHVDHAGAIRFNVKGRERNGVVEPGVGYDALADELIRDLMDIRDAETGEPVVEEVIKTREHYNGPQTHLLPDLFVVWRRDRPVHRITSPKIGVIEIPDREVRTGDHVQVGDLWANREYLARFAPGQKLRPADVTKVILASTNRADAKEEALIPALG